MRRLNVPLAAALALLTAFPAGAWEDHAQLSRLALASERPLAATVRAESLESFLEAEKAGIAILLAGFNARAGQELRYYPPLPAGLEFKGSASGPGLVAEFFGALRVNPGYRAPLFLKPAPGTARTRPELPVEAVDPFIGRFVNRPFESLEPGDEIAALDVIAGASDEPDYGMDVGLYEDNGTEAGRRYGLGLQPFGNPALDYGSQAPLHMAFAHESRIIAAAAPFTQRSLADCRFRLYSELARFAFAEDHDYWGYRFAGWALHYVEDLCQPYHSSLLPGLSAFRILALNAFGSKARRDAAVVLLSNRHAVVEDYAYRAVAARSVALEAALAGASGPRGGDAAYRDGWLYDEVAFRAFRRGRALDRLLVASFPARYVADPSYDYGAMNGGERREYDPYGALRETAPGRAVELDGLLSAIFEDLGGFSRAFVAYVTDPAAVPGPRRAPRR